MATLEIRWDSSAKDKNKPWKLFIRNNGPVDTEYVTVTYLTELEAKDLLFCSLANMYSEKGWFRLYEPEKAKDKRLKELEALVAQQELVIKKLSKIDAEPETYKDYEKTWDNIGY